MRFSTLLRLLVVATALAGATPESVVPLSKSEQARLAELTGPGAR